MTDLELISELVTRGLPVNIQDENGVLCEGALVTEIPAYPECGMAIATMGGEWLDCVIWDNTCGIGLAAAGHRNLNEALAWAVLVMSTADLAAHEQLVTCPNLH